MSYLEGDRFDHGGTADLAAHLRAPCRAERSSLAGMEAPGGEAAMSAHTAGPWSVSTIPGHVTDVRAPNGEFVANVDFDKRIGVAEVGANAKLIAAAPEMAEALRALLESRGPISADDAAKKARAALAKAGL